MAEQYYRVKLGWPTPYYFRNLWDETNPILCLGDTRFYTKATDLRGVHLDIQAHLAKYYAPEGLNEFDDFNPETPLVQMPLEDIVRMYGCLAQPEIQQIEVINSIDKVESIDTALEQIDLIKGLMTFITIGYVPSPNDWNIDRRELGFILGPLEIAVANVLRPYHNDRFDELNELVDKALEITRELNTFTRDIIKKLKG